MTQTEILNECKDEIAREYEFSSFHDLTTDLEYHAVKEKTFTEIENEAMILFAQRMAEKFAQWIMDARVGINREKGFVYPRESWDYYDHKELYQIFLTTLKYSK